MPRSFCFSICTLSTSPCSIGRYFPPSLCFSPMRAQNSANSALTNSGPLSVRSMVGRVPLRKSALAKARRTSEAVRCLTGSSITPWHMQHMYVKTYLFPSLSPGSCGPSRSHMISSQGSTSAFLAGNWKFFRGRCLNLIQVTHFDTQKVTSSFIFSQYTER